jgi:hypothetical protein
MLYISVSKITSRYLYLHIDFDLPTEIRIFVYTYIDLHIFIYMLIYISPDGNIESKVSIATFPVAHYLNHRTMRLNNSSRGYVFAFLGDEQSSPHFMRYSGLTGAIYAFMYRYVIMHVYSCIYKYINVYTYIHMYTY